MQTELNKLYAYEDSLKSIFDEIIIFTSLETQQQRKQQINTTNLLILDLVCYIAKQENSKFNFSFIESLSLCIMLCKLLDVTTTKENYFKQIASIYELLQWYFGNVINQINIIKQTKKTTK